MTQLAHEVVDPEISAQTQESLAYASRSTGRRPRPRSTTSALISFAFASLLLFFTGGFLIGAVLMQQAPMVSRDFRLVMAVMCSLFACGCFISAGIMGIMGLRWLPRNID